MIKNYIVDDKNGGHNHQNKKIAVVAHVNYPGLIDYCFDYIKNIPSYIDIYITTKGTKNIEVISEKISLMNRSNISIVVPEDRGREISGLLVACKEKLKNYEYICFVHDKRKNSGEKYLTVGQAFCDILWENMLNSDIYIENVIELLEHNENLGLLSPPIPYVSEFFSVGSFGWGGNYQKTCALAEKLNLNVKLDANVHPYVLGMTFWCKRKALEPLFEYDWKYTDFVKEPMPVDNTISHGIERILQYVAESQGYKSGWVMTPDCASTYYTNYRYMLEKIYSKINFEEEMEESTYTEFRLKKFIDEYDKFYIYGAGQKGYECLDILGDEKFLGFVVSDSKNQNKANYKIYSVDEIKPENNIGIIVAMGTNYMIEVMRELYRRGFTEIERYT